MMNFAGLLVAAITPLLSIGQPAASSASDEIELARSAAPAEMSKEASVYVFTDGGYVRGITGTNGYTCLVLRDDDPRARYPVCLDPEWTRCELPEYVKMMELLKRGTTWAQIEAEVGRERRAGAFPNPTRSGIAYMMSPRMRGMFDADNPDGRVQPHVMIYAPGATNQQIGVASVPDARRKRIPFVANEGLPNTHILVPMPAYSDGTLFTVAKH